MRRAALALGLLLSVAADTARAQQVLIDQGARVGGLWVFPSAANPDHYYYVPSQARLALDAAGDPQFSYLRYVINRPSAEGDSKSITEAEGGSVLHFLVTYDTPEEMLKTAQAELERRFQERPDVVLRGPVIFKAGRYALVSSIINPKGDEEPQLLTTGNAPVLEGSQIALSFELPPDRANLLWESFKMATPDVSLVFEMTLEGLTDAFDAELVIHWEDVHKNAGWGAVANLPLQYVGINADVTGLIDELRRSNAIELRTRGANPNLEALLDKIHNQLLELLFTPIPAEQQQSEPAGAGLGIAELAQLAKGPKGGKGGKGAAPGRPSAGIGVTASYKTKESRTTGVTVLNMNHQEPVQRVTTIGFDVGDLKSRYGENQKFFKTVNLMDPVFQQREIRVAVDGSILPEFDAFINSVTATLRKSHQNGETTLQEIVVDRQTFNQTKNAFQMVYGWNGDQDRDQWLEYEYRTRWSFKGGGGYETAWTRVSRPMIDLYAPYRRKVVKLRGDHGYLSERGIRAVIVELDYPFFEGRKQDKLRLRTDKAIENQKIELTLPLNVHDYHYRITWMRSQGDRIDAEGTSSVENLFVDELPPAADGTVAGAVPVSGADAEQ